MAILIFAIQRKRHFRNGKLKHGDAKFNSAHIRRGLSCSELWRIKRGRGFGFGAIQSNG